MGSIVSLLIEVISSKLFYRPPPPNSPNLSATEPSPIDTTTSSFPIDSTIYKIDSSSSTNAANHVEQAPESQETKLPPYNEQSLDGTLAFSIKNELEPNIHNSQNGNKTTFPIVKRKSRPELLVYSPTSSSDSKHEYNDGKAEDDDFAIHEFVWKYNAKDSVYLAGTFTDWIPSIPMQPADQSKEYWRVLVKLDPKVQWEFKFVVDGIWRCSLDLPTRTDSSGITNNIIYPDRS